MVLGMSLLDVLLISAALLAVFISLFRRETQILHATAVTLVTVAVLHVFANGLRWQVLPAYLATLLAIGALLNSRRWLSFVLAGFTTAFAGVAVAATWAFPVFKVPEVHGEYAVGTTSVFLTDNTREERYTEEAGDRRRIALRIWYPSDEPSSGQKRKYFEQALVRSKAITTGTPLPWFTFTHLDKISVQSRTDAAIAEGSFPALIYSHGLGIGWSSGNTPLVEHLASHGYIVIGIGHSFIGSSVIFPEGVARFDPATRIAMNTEPPEEIMNIYREVKEIKDPERQLEIYMRAMAMMPISIKGKVDEALQTQINDQQFVLDSLASLASSTVDLGPHINLTKVGLFGMSIGGSAAMITCGDNPACGAVVNMDGFHPDQTQLELRAPSLTLHRSDNLLVKVNFDRAKADAYLLEIKDTTHFNFFDFAMMSPLYQRLGVLGSIDGDAGLEIQREYVTAFFNSYLLGQYSPLLQGDMANKSRHAILNRRKRASADGEATYGRDLCCQGNW